MDADHLGLTLLRANETRSCWTALMTTEHFKLHEVVAGVWAAEGDLTGASVGNAAIIDVGGRTIIVDTFMTDVAAVELRRVAEDLTGNRVYLAINSHWHGDHTGGNQVFADVPIVSTRETLDMIIETSPTDIGAWQAEIDASIAALETEADDDEKTSRKLDQLQHFKAFAGNFRLTLPDLLIDDRLVVEGERMVEIQTRGKGHTISDTTVWLPDERLLVTGDLCWNGIHPRLNDGFPAAWADYVEALLETDPLHVIPGHGVPGTAEALRGLPSYFRTVETLIDEVKAGTDPTTLPAPEPAADWDGLARFHDGLRSLADR